MIRVRKLENVSKPKTAALVAALSAAVATWWVLAASPAVTQTGSSLCDASGTSQFSDVDADDYGADYILCAKALGLAKGKTATTFGAGDKLNRGQMATFLVRLWTEQLGRLCPTSKAGHPFTDIEGNFHEDDIACLWALGLTKGKTATEYGPSDDLSSFHITLFITRALNKAQSGTCDVTGSEIERSAACLVSLNIAPNTTEAKSHISAPRAQMAVYLVGAWHHSTGRGKPPVPPTLIPDSAGTTSTTSTTTSTTSTTSTTTSTSTTVPVADTLAAISSGGDRTCVVTTSGDAACWGGGTDFYGVLNVPSDKKFKAIDSGGSHVCGILLNGDAHCWGSNRFKQTEFPSGKFSVITAGAGLSCGVTTTGSLECWGEGSQNTPSGSFKAVSAGQAHTCAIRDNGSAVCWGRNLFGEATPPSGSFKAVSAGETHTCAIRDNGSAACWGGEFGGSTGLVTPPSGEFKGIATGSFQSCGIYTSGKAVCWGGTNEGDANAPSGEFKAISAGNYFSCGITVSGKAVCWGSNLYNRKSIPAEYRAQ